MPPVDTNATGIATFQTNGNTMNYQLSVSDINNVTATHIHRGDADHNGRVVVSLYKNMSTGPKTGLLSQSTIFSSDLKGPWPGTHYQI